MRGIAFGFRHHCWLLMLLPRWCCTIASNELEAPTSSSDAGVVGRPSIGTVTDDYVRLGSITICYYTAELYPYLRRIETFITLSREIVSYCIQRTRFCELAQKIKPPRSHPPQQDLYFIGHCILDWAPFLCARICSRIFRWACYHTRRTCFEYGDVFELRT